jgi:hypothetical protein
MRYFDFFRPSRIILTKHAFFGQYTVFMSPYKMYKTTAIKTRNDNFKNQRYYKMFN